MNTFHRLHTELVLMANAYLEMVCPDMDLPVMRRHWIVRRTVDYSRICIQ